MKHFVIYKLQSDGLRVKKMPLGDVFDGKYKIIKTIGHGGMSRVYLAENIRLGTLWAIKEIEKKPDTKLDFYTEPNILKKLNHPSLPRIFDIIEDEKSIYIIVDYIEGESLDRVLAREGKFPESIILKWARQLCDVLNYLHCFSPNPIIYRDMKPSNIILTADGSIKLIDFGIAREYKSGSESDTIYIGTRGYAAPEQYGGGQTNVATDIYSLGVTLYHLATGRSPNEPPYEIMPVRDIDKSLSSELEHIISTCTKINPADRYQSVRDILSELDKIEHCGDFAEVEARIMKRTAEGSTGENLKYYKKLVLTVWGNAEFASELAYMAAGNTNKDFNILLINLDFVSPKVDKYLNLIDERSDDIERNQTFENILEYASEDRLSKGDILKGCIKKLDNLYVLMSASYTSNYDNFLDKPITKLIDLAYRHFELTILVTNNSIKDIYTISALRNSDYNIIPINADLITIQEYINHVRYLDIKYMIPVENQKFIAYEYKNKISLGERILKEHLSKECYIGKVSYSTERERCRNLNMSYAGWMDAANTAEYTDILSYFNIVPKRTFFKKLKDHIHSRKTMGKHLTVKSAHTEE